MAKDKVVYLFGTKENTDDNFRKNVEASQNNENGSFNFVSQQDMPETDQSMEDATLYSLGRKKEAGLLNATWDEVADIMNSMFSAENPKTESSWRKRYTSLREKVNDKIREEPPEVLDQNQLRDFFHNLDKKHQTMRDERMVYARQIRSQSRQDQILDLFRETIQAWPQCELRRDAKDCEGERAIYAMLSDIHYGMKFNSYCGEYNSAIAEERVLRYADEIILAGRRERAGVCFVSLMGDMISGSAHTAIRVENKENVIEQVVGVSELVSKFLYYLGCHFQNVYINSVDGNHSRIEKNLEDTMRGERMDALIPWYCKAKLANQENIHFVENEFDTTFASFRIADKLFVSVHGDLERDLKVSCVSVEKYVGQHIDYFLSAHMHVPEMRVEDTTYIRNGSVCGSGDDYTMKRRLFSPACQVFMVIDDTGSVVSVHTVNLQNVTKVEKTAAAE